MRCVDRFGASLAGHHTRIEPTFGTVTMKNVQGCGLGNGADFAHRLNVSRPGQSWHGGPVNAEAAILIETRKYLAGPIAAAFTVAHNADLVTKLGLNLHKVANVPEQAANRCTKNVEYPHVNDLGERPFFLEPAFPDEDDVTWINRRGDGYPIGRGALDRLAGQKNLVLIGPWRVAAGKRNGVLHGHARLIRE